MAEYNIPNRKRKLSDISATYVGPTLVRKSAYVYTLIRPGDSDYQDASLMRIADVCNGMLGVIHTFTEQWDDCEPPLLIKWLGSCKRYIMTLKSFMNIKPGEELTITRTVSKLESHRLTLSRRLRSQIFLAELRAENLSSVKNEV